MSWSLGTGIEQRRIHDLVKFPCEFRFTAVLNAGAVSALLERVGTVIGRAVTHSEHSVRASEKGAYESVTLKLWVQSGDEVYSIYAAMQNDAGVRYLL
jgi:putative lipoic acid-binding regulatory protein